MVWAPRRRAAIPDRARTRFFSSHSRRRAHGFQRARLTCAGAGTAWTGCGRTKHPASTNAAKKRDLLNSTTIPVLSSGPSSKRRRSARVGDGHTSGRIQGYNYYPTVAAPSLERGPGAAVRAVRHRAQSGSSCDTYCARRPHRSYSSPRPPTRALVEQRRAGHAHASPPSPSSVARQPGSVDAGGPRALGVSTMAWCAGVMAATRLESP